MGQVEKSWFGPAASVTFSSVPKPFKMFITEYSSKIVIGMGGGGGGWEMVLLFDNISE